MLPKVVIFGNNLGGIKSDWGNSHNSQNLVKLQQKSIIPDKFGKDPAAHAEEETGGACLQVPYSYIPGNARYILLVDP